MALKLAYKIIKVIGVFVGVIIFGVFVLGKFIEYDCERQYAKNNN